MMSPLPDVTPVLIRTSYRWTAFKKHWGSTSTEPTRGRPSRHVGVTILSSMLRIGVTTMGQLSTGMALGSWALTKWWVFMRVECKVLYLWLIPEKYRMA